MSDQAQEATTPVPAVELRKALLEPTDEPYALDGAAVEGKLDLHLCRVRRPFRLSRCEFLGEVDARNALFEATACFLDCTFHGAFGSGEDGGDFSHTVYRSDLVCSGSTFRKEALFSGVRCGGSGTFHRCRFEAQTPSPGRKPDANLVDFSAAHFEKELNCSDAVFAGPASFNSVRCEYAAFFRKARFEGTANFIASSYGIACDLSEAAFAAAALLEGVSCGWFLSVNTARFDSPAPGTTLANLKTPYLLAYACRFAGPVDLSGSDCANRVELSLARFEHQAVLENLKTTDLIARGVLFAGPVSLSGADVRHNGDFQPLDLPLNTPPGAALVPGELPAALREELAKLNLQLPADARVEQRGDGWFLTAGGRKTDYRLIDGGGVLYLLAPAVFEHDVSLAHSRLGWALILLGAEFHGSVDGNAVRCDGGAFLNQARFHAAGDAGRVDLRFSHYGINLQLDDCVCHGPVDLEAAEMGNDLVLRGAELRGGIRLTNARMQRVKLGGGSPFAGRRLSRFRGWRFDALEADGDRGGPTDEQPPPGPPPRGVWRVLAFPFVLLLYRVPLLLWSAARLVLYRPGAALARFLFTDPAPQPWEQVVAAQDPRHFSTDVYLTLEQCYRSRGEHLEADRIYYSGRCAARAQARSGRTHVQWSPADWVMDTIALWVTGYGVRRGRLIAWIVAFLALGVVVFWPDDALIPAPGSDAAAAAAGAPTAPQPFAARLASRVGYSIDRFVPVVDLGLADRWRPADSWRRAYNAVHIAAGWFLVALFITAFTGVLKKWGT